MGLEGVVEGLEIWPVAAVVEIARLDIAVDKVWRRTAGGNAAAKLAFLLCAHERLRESLAASSPPSALPSLFIACREDELESGGVGYAGRDGGAG